MKLHHKSVLAASLLALAPASVSAQTSDNDDGAAQATIVNGLTLTKTSDLAFGAIIAGDTGGTATIDATSGNASQVGDTRLLPSTRSRARFTSNAPMGQLFLMVGDPTVTLNHSGGGASMVATLDYHANSGIGILGGLTPSYMAILPSQEILVGGTLAVGGNQQVGDYSGDFSLTITYL